MIGESEFEQHTVLLFQLPIALATFVQLSLQSRDFFAQLAGHSQSLHSINTIAATTMNTPTIVISSHRGIRMSNAR